MTLKKMPARFCAGSHPRPIPKYSGMCRGYLRSHTRTPRRWLSGKSGLSSGAALSLLGRDGLHRRPPGAGGSWRGNQAGLLAEWALRGSGVPLHSAPVILAASPLPEAVQLVTKGPSTRPCGAPEGRRSCWNERQLGQGSGFAAVRPADGEAGPSVFAARGTRAPPRSRPLHPGERLRDRPQAALASSCWDRRSALAADTRVSLRDSERIRLFPKVS